MISTVIQLIEISATSSRDLGGIQCVTCPALSFVNAAALNPLDRREVLPKFEFELVIERSPPESAKK